MTEKIWEGELLENRVVIFGKDSVELYDESGYGKPFPEENPDRLELELVEALYLLEKEKIKIVKKNGKKRSISFKDLMKLGTDTQKDFHSIFIIYRDLRERGYLVKTGFKFGTNFRVYERGVKLKRGPKAPHEHTKWIVHAVPEEFTCEFAELSRAVRLAHNIRAKMLWAVVDRENDVTYYEILRITP